MSCCRSQREEFQRAKGNRIKLCVEDGTEEEAPRFVPREGLGDLQESHFCAGEGVGALPDVKEKVGGEEAEVAGATHSPENLAAVGGGGALRPGKGCHVCLPLHSQTIAVSGQV